MPPRKKTRRKTTAKRKPTKRTRSRKGTQIQIASHVMREIYAVIYMALCVLTILSINGGLGFVGELWNNFLTPIFGWGLYAVPVLLGSVSLALFFARKVEFDATRTLGIGLMVVSVLGTLHLAVPSGEIYEVARVGEYGGYIGFVSSFLSRQVLGITGSYVVFLALFLISILLTFSVSLREIMMLFEWKWERKEKKKEPKAFTKKSIQENEDDMIIHTMKALGNDEEEVVFKFDDKGDSETLHLKKVEPGKEGMAAVDSKEEKEEDPGEKIPVEKIAEQLERAEAEAEELDEEETPWEFPSLDLLSSQKEDVTLNEDILREKAEAIKYKLGQFGIDVKMHDVHVGPTVIQYTLKPAEGVKLSKITGLKSDLALALAAKAIRIEAPIPGKGLVGIEVPNDTRAIVRLRELLESEEFEAVQKTTDSKLLIPVGRNVSGEPVVADLAKMPHLLVAGATGSGKSVATNAMLLSFLYQNSPKDLKLILIDPKQVELRSYNAIPHLLTPVITEPDKAAIALRWVVAEMNRRYTVCADAGHRNIDDYNNDPASPQKMPKIVILIDELADMMMAAGKEVEASICRIAQMARAVGIHLVVATQRPSVDVITGLIKANIPARIAFTVASQIDSRTIIDGVGAEDLLGQGDMLYLSGSMGKPFRLQGVFVSTEEIQKVTNRVKLTGDADVIYNEEVTARKTAGIKVNGVPTSSVVDSDDELYEQAIELIRRNQKASATMLQRHLKVGYSRAARLIDMLEENGVVGAASGAKPREVFLEKEVA
jgi:DNA segregation ATPase FtsK/SpoIIIE, S-DNA-T family